MELNTEVIKKEFEKLVNLQHEKLTLDQDIKVLKEGLEAEGLEKSDISVLVKLAALKAKEKLGDAEESANKTLELLELIS